MRLAVPALLLIVAAASAQAPPDPVAAFFKSGKAVELNIDIGPKEMDSLRREDRKYVKCQITEGKTVYKDVGIHLRGAAGSFRGIDDKPGLTLNMDKFVDGQKFHGMDKWHLANSAQDPSYLSELICGEMMRAAGVPAARIGHAVVKINGKLKGMYYLKEGYDSRFLKEHLGSNDGNFYDGGFLQEIDAPLKLVSTKKDVKDQADLKKLIKACQIGDHAKRFAEMEKLLSLDKFISYLCIEAITWDWDGYPMKRNNYRIYHDPSTDKITFIPSGMDQMFADVNGSLWPGTEGLVSRALIETPQGKARYLARMEEIMKTVYRPADLKKRLDETEKVVQAGMATFDKNQAKDLPNHVNRLRAAIDERAKVMERQMKEHRKK